MLGAIAASFLAVENKADSIVNAVSLYNIAAEKAAASAGGPGTFAVQLIDEIYNFNEDDYTAKRVNY